MRKILYIEKKLHDKNKGFLKSFMNTKNELRKVLQDLGEKEIVRNHLLSNGIIIRMYKFYRAQKWFNEEFSRGVKKQASHFFEDTIACYLRAYLEAFSKKNLVVLVEKYYQITGRKNYHPDIVVEAGGKAKFILETKTQVGRGRPLDRKGNVRKKDNELLKYTKRIEDLSRHFGIPLSNIFLVLMTKKNWMGGYSMKDILEKHRRAGHKVPEREQFVILSKEYPTPEEKKFPMTKDNQLTDADFEDFIEPLFKKIKSLKV